jgi:hypothetical protein
MLPQLLQKPRRAPGEEAYHLNKSLPLTRLRLAL